MSKRKRATVEKSAAAVPKSKKLNPIPEPQLTTQSESKPKVKIETESIANSKALDEPCDIIVEVNPYDVSMWSDDSSSESDSYEISHNSKRMRMDDTTTAPTALMDPSIVSQSVINGQGMLNNTNTVIMNVDATQKNDEHIAEAKTSKHKKGSKLKVSKHIATSGVTADDLKLSRSFKLPAGTTITAQSHPSNPPTASSTKSSVSIIPLDKSPLGNAAKTDFTELTSDSWHNNIFRQDTEANFNNQWNSAFNDSSAVASILNMSDFSLLGNPYLAQMSTQTVTVPTWSATTPICSTMPSVPDFSLIDIVRQHETSKEAAAEKALQLPTVTVRTNFLCQYCDLAFSGKTECVNHEKEHKREAPYKCNFCDLCVIDRVSLIAHIRHFHVKQRPYVCVLCSKGFCRRSDLRKHTVIHTGVRPFCCTMCGKSFSRNTNLTKHIRIHSGTRPHVCPHCPRSFANADELYRHIASHNGSKPYQCDKCPASFTRRDKLIVHGQMHGDFVNLNTLPEAGVSTQAEGNGSDDELPINNAVNNTASTSSNSAGRSAKAAKKASKSKATIIANVASSSTFEQDLQSNISLLDQDINAENTYEEHFQLDKASHPFICDVCNKTFTRECGLQRHMALHLDCLFTCSKCGITFNIQEKLIKHEEEKHSVENTFTVPINANYSNDDLSTESILNFLSAFPDMAVSELCQLLNMGQVNGSNSNTNIDNYAGQANSNKSSTDSNVKMNN